MVTLRVGPCEFRGTPAELAELWRLMGAPGAEPLPPDAVIAVVPGTTADWERVAAARSTVPDGRGVARAGTVR